MNEGKTGIQSPGERSNDWPRQLLRRWRIIPGFLILVAAFLAGEWLKARLGLIIPGNIFGLFLLLALLLTGVLPVQWVAEASAVLLWLLPLLFMPIFAASAEDKAFWARNGCSVFAAAIIGVVALWGLVGRLAQFFLKRHDEADAKAHAQTLVAESLLP